LYPAGKEEGGSGSAFNLGKIDKDMGVPEILLGLFFYFSDVRNGACPVTVLFRCFPFVDVYSPQREIPHSGKMKGRVAEENSTTVVLGC